MELHLPLVVATPTLLCLLAALAALLWPRRSVLWPFLLPAWGLDLCFLGLWQSRAELAGPVLVWFLVPGWLLAADQTMKATSRNQPTRRARFQRRAWRRSRAARC